MNPSPKVCVLNAPGINCNEETGYAFDLAGGNSEQVHISQLESKDRDLHDYRILVLSGGFSHGDDIASGRILGVELRTRMADELNRFVDMGGLVLGICNGFQVLVETGLIPAGRIDKRGVKTASLAHNENVRFECRWEKLKVLTSNCVFVDPIKTGETIELPVAHGEGKFLRRDKFAYDQLFEGRQVVFQYCDDEGNPTTDFPDNPNGSPYGITGITDETGHILGMMPHPERFVRPQQYVNYHRQRHIKPQGLPIFTSMIDYVKAA